MRGSIVKRGAGYAVVVELDRDPVSGKRRQTVIVPFRRQIIENNGFAFHVAERAKLLPGLFELLIVAGRERRKDADAPQLAWLLSVRAERRY